jgi:hypothetical protein
MLLTCCNTFITDDKCLIYLDSIVLLLSSILSGLSISSILLIIYVIISSIYFIVLFFIIKLVDIVIFLKLFIILFDSAI